MHHDLIELPRWGFAFPGRVRDELTALALAGTKTGTAGLLAEMEADGEAVPVPGERSVLIDSAERPVAIIETTSARVVRLADVTDEHAVSEGEGYRDAAEFRAEHERFWASYLDDLRRRLGDPAFSIDDDTLVLAERLRVVIRLDSAPAPVEVRLASPSRVPGLAAVLTRAFACDPMVTWPMVSADDLARRVRDHFVAVDGPMAAEGWLFEAGDGLGAMTLLPPGYEGRAAALAESQREAIAGLTPDGGARYERFWSWVVGHNPAEPHWLLDQLAVEPAAQGRGIGGRLVRHAIGRAEADDVPIVLETAAEANLALYARFGFRVQAEGNAPDGGPRVWFLRRDPGTSRT